MEAPQTLLMMTVSAFVLGWLVAKVSAFFGNRFTARARDPRDDRIRSLEAELRVAKSEADKRQDTIENLEKELAGVTRQLDDTGIHLRKQEEVIVALKDDLRESVKKTRELRTELTARAAENLKSEVKLREVETELSVAQASTDLLATGVLDYSVTADTDDDEGGRKVRQAKT
jgi:chromosome segregation ATPase